MPQAIRYLKASNAGAGDAFGTSLALSADGNTLAVGAPREFSNATGIGGDQTDNSFFEVGAVYVFTRSGNTWSQQAYIKASNSDVNDHFGISLALSADGNTLAVGAINEDSDATGVDGDQGDGSTRSRDSGAVYVFTRSGGTWSQQAYVKASNPGLDDQFGISVALSADGNTLAVGADGEDSNASGIGGDQANDSAQDSGAVYVFTRGGSTWSQQAYVKAANPGRFDAFGTSLALSANGSTLAVGAFHEGFNAVGSGAVYVFSRSGSAWSQQAYVKASNPGAFDSFGLSLALSADGNALAVGAIGEDSNATGVGGPQTDPTPGPGTQPSNFGAVYVFSRGGSTWSQQAYVKASNSGSQDWFGISVALSADGNKLAVGAIHEDSNATGVGGDQGNDLAGGSGAVYVFTRIGNTWSQQAYVKASNTGPGDLFGSSVGLSADGNTLAVGAIGEGSNATGVDGDQANNSAVNSGAVYLYLY